MQQTDPLLVAGISAGSAILGSLLTIVLTLWWQHHFWKRQRRDDLRFETVRDVNRVASEFIARYIEAQRLRTTYTPEVALFQTLHAVRGNVRALFFPATFQAFQRFEQAIGPNLDKVPGEGVGSIDEYLRRRDDALRALYQDLGIVRRLRST